MACLQYSDVQLPSLDFITADEKLDSTAEVLVFTSELDHQETHI